MRCALLALTAALAACSFDSLGKGTGSTAGGTDTGSTASSGPGTTSTTTGPTTSGPGTTTSTTSTTDPSTTDPSTSGPPPDAGGEACDGSLVQRIVKVENAAVNAPMQTTMSNFGEGIIALSLVPEMGDVIFTVDVPCDDTYYLWGRVNDFNPGTGDQDPDSYYISSNGGPEITWFYGCETFSAPQWSWAQVRSGVQGTPCEEGVRLELNLPAGTHAFKFRNREGESPFGEYAAIARIALINQPNAVPMD